MPSNNEDPQTSEEARERVEELFQNLREEGAFKNEASNAAPDFDESRFEDTEGQRYVENARRDAATALPENEKSLWEDLKSKVATGFRYVFEKPYLSWPEPTFEEKVADPLKYTGKDPERMMELAGIDPGDEPLSGLAPDTDDAGGQKALPQIGRSDFQKQAFDVIRERAQAGDREFYNKVASASEQTEDGFHEFLGNALMNETAESSGWVEDKTGGATLQDLVDEVVANFEGAPEYDPEELEEFVRESQDISDTDYPFDLDHFGDMESLYGVLSEALAHADKNNDVSLGGDNAPGWDSDSARESTFDDVIREFGRVYHSSMT